MPRIWVAANELTGPTLVLEGEPHRYLTRVLRLGAGATVELFDGEGGEVSATIERAGTRDLTLALGARRQVSLPATPPVTLLQGLPRPERMDLVVQKAAELGAARVIPVRTARSAGDQPPRPERWEKIAREAARQCGRAQLLAISPTSSLGDALGSLEAETLGVVPWEDAPDAAPLHALVTGNPRAVAVLIGPEGGLTKEEVALATGAGFRVATLGPRILRTETAAIAALAVIQSRVGGLG
ncbi:MAG TPA: 16S rRNA (uracil(1498)-N(3))-methyltransferase [Polyangia bacterium]|nr:16S rRNA (uracil(1498)-N(3))-methyltransferase [Polyangia bacterium]